VEPRCFFELVLFPPELGICFSGRFNFCKYFRASSAAGCQNGARRMLNDIFVFFSRGGPLFLKICKTRIYQGIRGWLRKKSREKSQDFSYRGNLFFFLSPQWLLMVRIFVSVISLRWGSFLRRTREFEPLGIFWQH